MALYHNHVFVLLYDPKLNNFEKLKEELSKIKHSQWKKSTPTSVIINCDKT